MRTDFLFGIYPSESASQLSDHAGILHVLLGVWVLFDWFRGREGVGLDFVSCSPRIWNETGLDRVGLAACLVA